MRFVPTLCGHVAPLTLAVTCVLGMLASGCSSDSGETSDTETDTSDTGPTGPTADIYSPAGGCFTIEASDGTGVRLALATTAGADSFAFVDAAASTTSSFRLRAADLGTYLLYDADRTYVSADVVAGADPELWSLTRPSRLDTAVALLDDAFISPAEWQLEPSLLDAIQYQLMHRASGRYLGVSGLAEASDDAAIIELVAAEGCAVYPELTLDATGEVVPHTWDDGAVYGIAELHSHLNTNAGFGGGGVFHGAPFHRLGVEYALPSCEVHHGEDGKRDIVGFFFDGNATFDLTALLPILTTGEAPDFNHATAGYPDFTEWPNPRKRATHQAMYYRWLERAHLGGLRLMVELATTNSILCDLVLATGAQGVRYECNDMVNVQRQLQAARDMERYIDAQSGGPGKGWFRVVESPQEARDAINLGKLAVVLGIEVSNLFDCFSTPKAGFDGCTPESVDATLDTYKALGVRAIFPVHKYDNAFTSGDGSSGIIELGNLLNSGHYSNFVEDCPGIDTTFDGDSVSFGGLNRPRENYFDPPPIDVSAWRDNLVGTIAPLISAIQEPALEGSWCQKHGMTPLGEHLIQAMMDRGLLIDIGHLPQRALGRVYTMLEANGYPATKTHGNSNGGRLYNLNGLRGSNIGRCGRADRPGGLLGGLAADVQARLDAGHYPAEGLSFDLNGFAGHPRPRFGPDSNCTETQENPVTYPFTSHDGTTTFEAPKIGNRAVDFNTEGMIHIGLLPELLEDARQDGATDAMLEPLFRSAEAYLRMWEQAEAVAAKP
ncbi:MAG: microsomal dipeptidase-like Zn-dependent dipeptidase [Myxococcota bacterium]|jgi:microsomal dipeptidase-like Zn-dependent dipeptidase